jgi:hypothetical protein
MVSEERANPASIERDEDGDGCISEQNSGKDEIDAPGKDKYSASLSSAVIRVLGFESKVAFRHSTRSLVEVISKRCEHVPLPIRFFSQPPPPSLANLNESKETQSKS